jgi:sugar lactone lactonase YvrE
METMKRKKLIGLGLTAYLSAVVGITVFSTKSQQSLTSDAQVNESATPVVRGVAGDFWADVVIGKRDFGEIGPREVVSHKVHAPGGVAIDSTTPNEKLYVWDSGNNRILGIDLTSCRGTSEACEAAIVIGQPALSDWGACNQDASFQHYPYRAPARADTLCATAEYTHTTLEDKSLVTMATDAQGSLYVPDLHNHRVLKYVDPFGTDQIADQVWGQADMTGNLCNQGASAAADSFCFDNPGGAAVAFDDQGNMWVVDGKNNRVLRFSKAGDVISNQADLVLGQSSFTSNSPGIGMNQLSRPTGLAFDAQGRLFVADSGNNRVIVYEGSFEIGMTAQQVFVGDLNYVTSVTTDPQGRGMWVFDHSSEALKLYDFNGSLIESIHEGRGGGSVAFDDANTIFVSWYQQAADVISYAELSQPRDQCAANDGNVGACSGECAYYYCSNQCWLRGTPDLTACYNDRYAPVQKLFKPTNSYNQMSASRLEHSAWQGLTLTDSQLVVSDSRLLFWNNPENLANGQAADGYVGAESFLTIPQPQYGQVDSDASSRIWATRKDRVEMFEPPLEVGETATLTIGPRIPVLNASESIDLIDVSGVAISPDSSYLWISESGNHRVMRVSNPLTNPRVDIVLGQDAIANNTTPDNSFYPSTGDANHPNLCNRGAFPPAAARRSDVEPDLDMLCFPGSIALDKLGNLYVSDHMIEIAGNLRLLVFDASIAESTASQVQFSPDAFKAFLRNGSAQGSVDAWTFQPAFGPQNQMVIGFNPYTSEIKFTPDGMASGAKQRFLHVFNDPAGASLQPDAVLNDFYNWPVAMDFDAAENLYALDANRGQVRIYKQPFAEASPSISPAISITPTGSPRSDPPSPTSAPISPTLVPTMIPTSEPSPSLLSCPSFESALSNPSFDAKTRNWRFYSNNGGKFSVGNRFGGCGNVARIALKTAKGNVQFYQNGVMLKPNTRYRLAFIARSNKGSDFAISLYQNSSEKVNYGLDDQRVDIITQWQQHELEFTTSGFSQTVSDARLRFWFPGFSVNNDAFFIDSVVLEEAQ